MQSNTQSRAPRRILIADDESLIRLDLREMLTHLGYDVVGEAGDGRQAVELARKLKPDLVIMDIRMPEVDGIQAAGILTSERIAPVVLLTAYSDTELVEQAREAGVVGYVVKPFREAELMPVIELSFARFEEFRALEKEIGNLSEALESRKVVERAKGVLMEYLPAPRGRSIPPDPQDQHGLAQVDEGSRRGYPPDASNGDGQQRHRSRHRKQLSLGSRRRGRRCHGRHFWC